VVRDKILGTPGDLGQIADTQLPALAQRRRQHQPRRIRECPRPLGRLPGDLPAQQPLADLLGPRSVYSQQITSIVVHSIILMYVDTLKQGSCSGDVGG
jgi:hypothetical protein